MCRKIYNEVLIQLTHNFIKFYTKVIWSKQVFLAKSTFHQWFYRFFFSSATFLLLSPCVWYGIVAAVRVRCFPHRRFLDHTENTRHLCFPEEWIRNGQRAMGFYPNLDTWLFGFLSIGTGNLFLGHPMLNFQNGKLIFWPFPSRGAFFWGGKDWW